MKFLKTDFAKVHAAVATVALINVLMALLLKLGLFRGGLYSVAVTVHVICGFLILPASARLSDLESHLRLLGAAH